MGRFRHSLLSVNPPRWPLVLTPLVSETAVSVPPPPLLRGKCRSFVGRVVSSPVSLSLSPSLYLSLSLSPSPCLCLCPSISVLISLRPSVSTSVSLSVSFYLCLSLSPSPCLSTSVSLSLCLSRPRATSLSVSLSHTRHDSPPGGPRVPAGWSWSGFSTRTGRPFGKTPGPESRDC